MGSPSFLAHQRRLEEDHGRSNCQTLSGRPAIPADAYTRLLLGGAATASFDPLFFKTIETEGLLAPFHRLGGRVLLALDGTERFCSREVHRARCSTPKRSDGGTGYAHALLGATIVAPGHHQVLPLPPEFIVPHDGAEKTVTRGKRTTTIYRWMSTVPLRAVDGEPAVNGFSIEIQNSKGKRIYYSLAFRWRQPS
jgi:hypothetical protein